MKILKTIYNEYNIYIHITVYQYQLLSVIAIYFKIFVTHGWHFAAAVYFINAG